MNSSGNLQSGSLVCQHHPGVMVSHVCMNKTCFLPLCTKCIKDHNVFHKSENTYSAIEEIDDVKDQMIAKVKDSMVNFTGELDKIEGTATSPIVSTEGLSNLQQSKKILYDLIDDHYRELETALVKGLSVSEIQKNNPQNYRAHTKIKAYIEKLEAYYAALQKGQLLKYLKPLATTNFEHELEKMKEYYDAEKTQKKTLTPGVVINPQFIKEFEKLLKSYTQVIEGKPDTPSEVLSPQHLKKSSTTTSPSKAQSYTMKTLNYFDTDIYKRYLHFFQHKSKNLFLLDIDACEKTKKFEFDKIELNIDFKIPRWHRSIVTPFGEIYMTGGVDVDQTDVKLNKSYVYDFNNNTLIEVMNMHVGRSGHALVYLQGYLYAIGGFSQAKEFTRQCERYNIRNDTWEEIASLNVGSNNPCACTFNDRYIYKFGGKIDDTRLCNYIERYSPAIDKWTIVQYEVYGEPIHTGGSNLLLSSAACCQINEKEILVFGGTHADYSQKSNSSFVLHVEKEPKRGEDNPHTYSVRNYNKHPLPIAEGFWNNQAVVVDSKMYALQNVQNEKNVSIVYLDRRRILRYHPDSSWISLN